jgi:hypothetical protein
MQITPSVFSSKKPLLVLEVAFLGFYVVDCQGVEIVTSLYVMRVAITALISSVMPNDRGNS